MADGSSSTFRVSFKEPLEIQQGEYYVASAKLKGPDSFYGISGLRRIIHDCGLDGKVTFNFAYGKCFVLSSQISFL
jgi:BTB/POZ domain-containing protein 1/2